MAGLKYSVEQLQHLRESPLVKKPDSLPSIEQWMDVPPDQNNNNNNNNTGNASQRRTRTNLRDGDTGATGEHRADRAILNPMGQFGRRQSMQHGEDTVLGPPKLHFASAMRSTKTGQTKEATGITSIDGEHLGDRFPRGERGDRWRDRDTDRNREKPYANGRRAGREEGDGWTNVKGRKSLNQEDFDRGFGRNGDRKREELDPDNGDAPLRRAGNRWGRRDDKAESEGNRFGGAGQGGWRDRERNKEREKDREWNRGGKEEDPEWMDTPVGKKESKIHTQEDFQRWKEQMKAKDAPVEEKEEPKPEQIPAEEALPAMSANPAMKSVFTPTALEPGLGSMFGTWGKDKAADIGPPEPAAAKAKPDKKSRFMTMFATKAEEPSIPAQAPLEAPVSPEPLNQTEDQAGFARILQMLGGANISAQGGPGLPTPTNGTRQAQGGIPLEFQHQSPPPEIQEQRAPPHQVSRTLEQQALLENILAPRPSGPESRPSQQARFNSMSPDNPIERFGAPRPDSNRPADDFPLQQPPSRNNNPQDPNLAAILNSRSREAGRENKQAERDFLLTLMQQPRNTPPQLMNHNLPRQAPENHNLPFFDQPGNRPQGQPKGRGGPPPGFMEDPRVFEDLMRREQQHLRELQQQEAMRNKAPRGMPMGFPGHDDPALAGLQRRNTAGEIPRQMTNMGIPSQPMPDMPYMGVGARQPGGMPPTPQERQNIAPPPGFGGPMRQPPGLGGPGGPGGPQQQQQQMGGPSFSAGNTPMGHPPGFPPPGGNMRGGGFPGAGGNGMQGPPPPQGYFPPPGYGGGPPPPMGMRGEDPRLLFEQQQQQQQFGGLGLGGPGMGQGPRGQQGRPGMPGMY